MTLRWTLKQLLQPPGPMVLLLLLALMLWRWKPRVARTLVILATVLLWVSSAPVVVDPIYSWLQDVPPATVLAVAQTQAIVVLGAGRIGNAREWAREDQVNRHGLIRLRYGAYLARETGLSVAVSGGAWPYDRVPESELMRKVLAEQAVSVRWQEAQSLTTWDNALNMAKLLQPAGIKHITLVTQAHHMRRAKAAFERAGFAVLPAATDYAEAYISERWTIRNWVPSNAAMVDMNRIIYEVMGMVVYWVKYKLQ